MATQDKATLQKLLGDFATDDTSTNTSKESKPPVSPNTHYSNPFYALSDSNGPGNSNKGVVMSASPVPDTISMGGPPQSATGMRDLSISDAMVNNNNNNTNNTNKSNNNTISHNNNNNNNSNSNNEVMSLFDSLNSNNSIINNNKNQTHTHYSHTSDSDDDNHRNNNNNNHKDSTKKKHKKKSSNNFGKRKNNSIEKALLPSSSSSSSRKKALADAYKLKDNALNLFSSKPNGSSGHQQQNSNSSMDGGQRKNSFDKNVMSDSEVNHFNHSIKKRIEQVPTSSSPSSQGNKTLKLGKSSSMHSPRSNLANGNNSKSKSRYRNQMESVKEERNRDGRERMHRRRKHRQHVYEWRTVVFIRHGKSKWNAAESSILSKVGAVAQGFWEYHKHKVATQKNMKKVNKDNTDIMDAPLSREGIMEALRLSSFLRHHAMKEHLSNYQDLFESCRLDLETVLPFLQDADEQTRTHIVRKLQKTLIKMNNYLANENDLSYNASGSQTSSAAQTPLGGAISPPFRMFQETGAPAAAVHVLQSVSETAATTKEGSADNDTNGNHNNNNNNNNDKIDSKEINNKNRKSEKEKEKEKDNEKENDKISPLISIIPPLKTENGDQTNNGDNNNKNTNNKDNTENENGDISASASTTPIPSTSGVNETTNTSTPGGDDKDKSKNDENTIKRKVKKKRVIKDKEYIPHGFQRIKTPEEAMSSNYVVSLLIGTHPLCGAVTSNLRRAISTCIIALWDRLERNLDESIYILGCLQEVGANSDTKSTISGVNGHPTLSRHEKTSSLLCNHDMATVYRDRLSMQYYRGDSSDKPKQERLAEFALWLFEQKTFQHVITVGHSTWFQEFFKAYLPKNLDVNELSVNVRDKKIKNCGVVAFRIKKRYVPSKKHKHGKYLSFEIAPKSITPLDANPFEMRPMSRNVDMNTSFMIDPVVRERAVMAPATPRNKDTNNEGEQLSNAFDFATATIEESHNNDNANDGSKNENGDNKEKQSKGDDNDGNNLNNSSIDSMARTASPLEQSRSSPSSPNPAVDEGAPRDFKLDTTDNKNGNNSNTNTNTNNDSKKKSGSIHSTTSTIGALSPRKPKISGQASVISNLEDVLDSMTSSSDEGDVYSDSDEKDNNNTMSSEQKHQNRNEYYRRHPQIHGGANSPGNSDFVGTTNDNSNNNNSNNTNDKYESGNGGNMDKLRNFGATVGFRLKKKEKEKDKDKDKDKDREREKDKEKEDKDAQAKRVHPPVPKQTPPPIPGRSRLRERSQSPGTGRSDSEVSSRSRTKKLQVTEHAPNELSDSFGDMDGTIDRILEDIENISDVDTLKDNKTDNESDNIKNAIAGSSNLSNLSVDSERLKKSLKNMGNDTDGSDQNYYIESDSDTPDLNENKNSKKKTKNKNKKNGSNNDNNNDDSKNNDNTNDGIAGLKEVSAAAKGDKSGSSLKSFISAFGRKGRNSGKEKSKDNSKSSKNKNNDTDDPLGIIDVTPNNNEDVDSDAIAQDKGALL